MSANIKASKMRTNASGMPGVGSVRPLPAGMYRGDPGFFGDLWGGIKGAATGLVTGGPLGAIGGAIGGFTGASRDPAPPQITPMLNPRSPFQSAPTGIRVGGLGPGGAAPYIGLDRSGGGASPAQRAGKPSGTPGYHWNKSGYFLKSGQWIEAGTKEVRNRKMNPLNPRAVKTSMTRLGRAKTASKDLSRVTIRAKKCNHR